MINSKLYKEIARANTKETNIVVTVLEGEHYGEKLLISSNDRFKQIENESLFGTFLPHRDNLLKLTGAGITETGGQKIFYEQLTARKRMVICGAGHVANALIRIGGMAGFELIVIDDRPEYAERARVSGADHVIYDEFVHALENFESDENTYFVVMTREHLFDLDCLRCVLKKERAYVGMMGSRRKTKLIHEKLMSDGFSEDEVKDIHMPIGLSIGAQTPEEIAVSVLAEIIQVCNARHKSYGYPDEIMAEILKAMSAENRSLLQADKLYHGWVLATIIEKKGSAPRDASTKMIVKPDGTLIGTIGGGAPEATVIERAKRMALQNNPVPEILLVDLTTRGFTENILICGGTMKVYVEKL